MYSGSGGGVGCGVDKDEAARGAIVSVRIERDRTRCRYLDDANVVHPETVNRLMLKCLDVGAMKDAGYASVECLSAVLE